MKRVEHEGAFTRRWFIGGLAGIGATSGMRLFAAPGAAAAPGAKLKLGILSDVHIRNPGDEAPLMKAFSYFRDAGVDGVLIAGDIADTGRRDQLQLCADSWYKAFPGDKAPDGRHVEKLFIYGNHDMFGWKWANKEFREADPESYKVWGIGYEGNPAKIWEEVFNEKYEPIWMKNVKGYTVIGAHWMENDSSKHKCGGIEIEEFMKKHGKELDPSKPFFYTQHPHLNGTCFGSWAWGRDDGRATRALSPFPNAVAFSGHSHYTLTDERSVWQGAFTSINTSSLKYSSTDYALRENMDGNGSAYGDNPKVRPRAMTAMNTYAGKQGMVMSVFDDRIVLERHEFVTDQSLGDDWVIPLPCAESKPFAYAEHAKRRVAPEFDEGAVPKASLTTVDVRGQKVEAVELTFPPARTRSKCRVFEYEITATLLADEVELVQLQRRVMAYDYFRPETAEGREGLCRIPLSDFKFRGKCRFDVRPIECFGHKGSTISTTIKI